MNLRTSTRRSTRRRDTPPVRTTALGGVAVVLLLMVLGWQALRVYNGVPGRDYRTIYVSTPEVGNLLSHDQVRIAGARVGQVLGRDIGEDGDPRLQLQIEPGTDIPRDTKVAVRGAGLLGARYIELIPGQSPAGLPEGATLRGTDDSYTFGLAETLDTFDRETRGALGAMVGGLGQGLLGHGERLNDGLVATGTQSRPFGEFAAAILAREGAAARLVPALESATAPLDAERERLAELAPVAADAVEPFVERRAGVRSTLEAAPGALTAARDGLTAGSRLVASLRGAAGEATTTLAPAPAGLRGLSALLREGREPLRRAADLLDAAVPAVPGALRITGALRPVLEPLTELVGDLRPILAQTNRYACDIANFATTMRSMTGYTQPGEGPHGPAQAFRLQVVIPLSTDVVGVRDDAGPNTRRGVVAPCTFLAKPYPQFVPRRAGR